MKNRRLSSILLGSTFVLVFSTSSHAVEVIKANNTDALNLGSSWVGGSAPGLVDVAVWNNTVTAANATVLGASISWQGIKVVNPTGLVTINNGNTLTLGSSGIDIASTNAGISIRTAVTLGANQSFVIGNSSAAQDLLFDSPSSGLAFNMGGFAVGTSGLGTMRFTSGHTISNGTFNLDNANSEFQSGGGRTMTLNNDVNLNLSAGKQLTFGINSAPGGGLAVSSAAALNINGGTVQINSSGASGTNRMEQTGKVSFTGTSTVNNASAFSYFTNFSGEIALAGTTTWNSSGSSNANTTISGPLTGSGILNYRGTSANHRTDLSGDNSAFAGTINLDGGSGARNLRLTTANSGSATATWVTSAGNILQVDGVAVNLGTLNGAGTVTNSHATNVATITVGSGTFSGVISNGTPVDGMALTKTGVGTLALNGANSYTGLTDIQGGTLTTTTAETGGGAVSVADSATLGVTQLSNGDTFSATTLTMGSTGGSTLELTPAAAPSTALVTTGTFTVNGSTTLRLKGLPVAGTTLVSYTSTNLSGTSGLNLVMPFRIGGTLNNTGSAITLATVQDETPKWRNGNGVWDINTSGNWKTSTTSTTTNYLQGGIGSTDSVIFDDTSSGTSPITVTLNTTVSPVAITVAGTKDYIISGGGTIAGTTGITKGGTSALTLATANTFSGGVLLNQGTLNVNHATALGSGTLTIAGGAFLNNTSGSPIIATNAQNWNGDFTFNGSNDLGLGSATMNANCQVTVTANTLTVGGIAGAFSLTKEGSGTLALGAASSYSGATTVNNGVLKATAANSFSASSAVTLSNVLGVALDLNGFNQTVNTITGGGATGGNIILGGGVLTTGTAASAQFDGAISGAGGLTKVGIGTLTLAGLTTGYTGATAISGGVLDVGNVNNFLDASGTLTMTNGSVLQGSGTITRTVGNGNAVVSGNGGFAARGGQLDVDLDDPAIVGASFFNLNGGGNAFGNGLVLGSASADSKVRILSSIGINNFNGTRTISVNPGTGTANAEIAGVISNGQSTGNNGINKTGNGELILSGANTYTGDTVINAGSVTLAATGQLTFVPTTNGTVNKIRGVGSVALNGAVSFNLAGANTTPGNVWKIVDDTPATGLASNTVGGTFSVVGFTESSNVWTRVQGGSLWTFTEATRELTVQPAPGFAGWISQAFANGTIPVADQDANDDPDGDGVSNLVEYALAGLDPTVPQGSVGILAGGVLTFNMRALAVSNGDVVHAIEESDDLGISDPWAVVTPDVNNGTIISYTLPTAGPKLFARLKVTKIP